MPIMPAALNEVRRLFPAVGLYQIYATTDAGLVSFLRPEDHAEMSQTTGRPVFNTESRIVDESGDDVAVGAVGEIIVNLETSGMLYYWRNEAGTRSAVRHGWLYTGDLARRERDGYFTLVDRKNFMIISGGENIYPREVEEVISRHPAVKEVAVFGIPDDKYGETVCAAVSLRTGFSATADEIMSFCGGKIARYKRPRRVDFWHELPKTPVGKLAKTVLRDPYWAERARRV
jgi:acyl-CoA synthetase (AMP-forming)/AMP-acid ligase II